MNIILKNTMDNQQIFDKAVAHLRNQNAKSTLYLNEEVYSAFRGSDNRKCVGGIFIEDFEYNPNMEDTTFGCLLSLSDTPQSLKDSYSKFKDLIDELNFIHDWYEINEWEKQFKIISKKYKITYTEPTIEKEDSNV